LTLENFWQTPTEVEEDLAEAVRGSRTIGAHKDLVLHGGGNSSIKSTITDPTGRSVQVVYVKGSGWDMATIEPRGFVPLRISRLHELLEVENISDTELVNELRCAMTNAKSPDPSIESLLHALLPHRAVLHSHADAIISLSNQPDPEQLVRQVYGDTVVVVPYVMPGFDLARVCNEIWPEQATDITKGMVLLNHGLFTFGESMEEAYALHIRLISEAETFLTARGPTLKRHSAVVTPSAQQIVALRKSLSDHAKRPLIVSHAADDAISSFVTQSALSNLCNGPATPDHIIRTKQLPLVGEAVSGREVAEYVAEYIKYFERNRHRSRDSLSMLDPTPRYILDSKHGMYSVGKTKKDADIVFDIVSHTFKIITDANAVGTYTSLAEGDLFDIEYWELEQAKLLLGASSPELSGQIAIVTGAASGIGRACAEVLMSLGASVVGIDISASVVGMFEGPQWLGLCADVCDRAALDLALEQTALTFGGLDILVLAAGVFGQSSPISDLEASSWDRTIEVNFNAAQRLLTASHPLLKNSPVGGKVVLIGTKNVAAPGPGAAAYSTSKAALIQLGRVAALEWAADGIRVNFVHPDAVFDTGLWTPELLAERAAKYEMTVDEYKHRNLLSTEVTSNKVAQMVGTMCTDVFSATTGAQVPVDGGNERVI